MNDERFGTMILVVDDDPMLLNLVQKCMRKEGYQSAGARTGKETVEWLKQNHADLMLLDFRLPDMDAEELAGILAESGDLVPFIVFTGHESVQTSVRMLKKGARDYLMKDGTLLELLPSVVAQILAQLEKEKRLTEAEDKLRKMFKEVEKSRDDILSIMNTLRIGTAMTDENGLLTFLSETCKPFVGDEEFFGKPWQLVCPFNESDKSLIRNNYELPESDREKISVNVEGKDGRLYWMDVEIKDDPRNSRGRIFFFYDMSEVHDLRLLLDGKARHNDLVGKSSPMRQVFQRIQEVSHVDSTVLIEGETGTGKEMVARTVHYSGHRKNGPFIGMNCAGLSDSLLESQLFGHRRGSFTGAIDDHLGFFEAANGGTLFLDEIGDIPMNVQNRLLRVLQEREITRLGESKARKIDVRVLAATQHDLERLVAEGKFRPDLFYRVCVARVHLPPLRDRREDIPLLSSLFLRQSTTADEKEIHEISHETMRALMDYRWPGNVRELQNVIEFAVIRCKGSVIQIEDLPPEVNLGAGPAALDDQFPRDEKGRLLAALEQAGGNRSRAAQLLGVSRATLYRHMSRLGLPSSK